MQRIITGLILLGIAGAAAAQSSNQCASASMGSGLPVQPTLVAPLTPEFAAPAHQLGAPTGVLAQAFDETLAVDNVLLRQRLASCLAVAKAPAATAPALPATPGSAAYQPKTQFDNTPWRFDMSQNGKRMTAEEFDAWMKARGVRVAKGAPAAATAPPVEAPKPPKKK
ncbi:hypothetical protein [Lysobacter solisilvae (ex Woo and Kim 2020)]|uniref:Secreted protein n=1 Tax=Agrilutibacter terrestris TaxID=2865112 RepID=A0A7H0FV88_9GAMM|nr:hypothetical protein [Lysobacter terrestris]QNP39954.1 hypothetical protein H8B22_10630 [Lysobacter terrestris]